MMKAVLTRAAGLNGLRQVSLNVATTQAAARALYDSLGFRIFGVERHTSGSATATSTKSIEWHISMRERPHRPLSSPVGIAANSGCTLTTPYWRSSRSRFAAIIHRKLIEPPGAATFGW